MEHKLVAEYLSRLATFEKVHPPAFRFLKKLQEQGPEDGLWLITASNAHLYKGDAFLAYLKLNCQASKPPSLLLSPNFNMLINADATDQSARLFPVLLNKLIMASRGFSARWAVQRTRPAIELSPRTPDAFFDALLDALKTLSVVNQAAS
jgi:hypothetical protein